MEKSTAELRRLKRSLDKMPRIPGINGFFNFRFLEERAGRKDAQENQICEYGEAGHITPHINDKSRLFDSYIDKMYLKTSLNLDPFVTEANSLVVEFNLNHRKKYVLITKNRENAQRQAAMEASDITKREKRNAEILTRIAEIRAESDMIDESLKHHIERAEGVFRSRISRYWRGILSASAERLEHFPNLEERESEGRKTYLDNRKKLVTMIDNAIVKGGGIYDEEA